VATCKLFRACWCKRFSAIYESCNTLAPITGYMDSDCRGVFADAENKVGFQGFELFHSDHALSMLFKAFWDTGGGKSNLASK